MGVSGWNEAVCLQQRQDVLLVTRLLHTPLPTLTEEGLVHALIRNGPVAASERHVDAGVHGVRAVFESEVDLREQAVDDVVPVDENVSVSAVVLPVQHDASTLESHVEGVDVLGDLLDVAGLSDDLVPCDQLQSPE